MGGPCLHASYRGHNRAIIDAVGAGGATRRGVTRAGRSRLAWFAHNTALSTAPLVGASTTSQIDPPPRTRSASLGHDGWTADEIYRLEARYTRVTTSRGIYGTTPCCVRSSRGIRRLSTAAWVKYGLAR